MYSPIRHTAAFLTLLVGTGLLFAAPSVARAETPSPQPVVAPAAAGDSALKHAVQGAASSAYTPLAEVPSGAQQVTIGIYPVDVYDIDFKANTFALSAYVWVKWKGEGDPTLSMEFTNVVEEWGLMRTNVYEAPIDLGGGEKYQVMKLNAHFFQPFQMRNYPLDTQQLTIDIEDSASTVDKLVYLTDTKATALDADLRIPGWTIGGLTAQSQVHDYRSNFGDTTTGPEGTKYASLTFSIDMTRNASFFAWKLLFPLVVVLLTTWLALLLKPRWVDLRTGMPVTALLTVVFLQISYADSLPQVSELVLMDKIYVLVYALVVGTLIQIVWGNRKFKEDDTDEAHAKVWRLNVISAIAQAAIFAAGLATLTFLR